MNPATQPLILIAAAVICLAMAARARGGGLAVGRSVPGAAPRAVAWALRLPAPGALAARLARAGDGERLQHAGLDGVLRPGDLARARAALALWAALPALAGAALAPPLVIVALPAAAAGAWVVDWSVGSRARERRTALVRELPDLLDLLGICVAAGMALDPALEMASRRLGGVLGDEIGRTLDDMALGMSRVDAYRALAARGGSPPLADAVAALLQAEELGSPLSVALGQQAAGLRALRHQLARRRAATAAPKIQLVVALVMVPAVMLLVMGILVIRLAQQIGAVVGS